MKDIVILGDGGFAKEVAYLIECINGEKQEWNILGFVSKDKTDIGKKNGKYPVAFSDEMLSGYDKPIYAAIGIGDPAINEKMIARLKENNNIRFPNLVHPGVTGGWDRIKMGEGNIVCAGTIFTIDIEVGSFNIINLGCTIGHDSHTGNFNVLSPFVNISGGAQLGDKNLIGTGTHILQYLKIGNNNRIGAGSVINFDIETEGTYVTLPARRVK
jgi:sugar O-acyltransferase (sialic acid O-acetyltransferase NeuD family)